MIMIMILILIEQPAISYPQPASYPLLRIEHFQESTSLDLIVFGLYV